MKKCLYLSVFFIAFFSSCSDNELEEMSNSVPVSKYPQKVIDISMESPESFSHFSNISITRSSELLKDSNSEERVIEILLKCEKLSGLSIEISITFWGYFETGTELDIFSNSLSEHEEKKAT